MEVDVFKIITTIFNVELNNFIAKFGKEEEYGKIQTGGLMEIRLREAHQFYAYAQWLDNFRDQLFEKSRGSKMDFKEFEKKMTSLLQLYAHLKLLKEYHVFSKEAERELDEYFLEPFSRFLSKLDKVLGSNFVERAREVSSRTSDVVIKVTNVFGAPVLGAEVQVSYVRLLEFREHAKTYPLFTLKTDETGCAKARLLQPLEGGYRIDVKKYGKTAFLDVSSCNYVEIKVFDLLNLFSLLKYKLRKLMRAYEVHAVSTTTRG